MSSSPIEIVVPAATNVVITDDTLAVDLSDGRTISVPLAWYPRLVHASQNERMMWRLIGRGEGIHWPELDEDISVEALIVNSLSSTVSAYLSKRCGGLECESTRQSFEKDSQQRRLDAENFMERDEFHCRIAEILRRTLTRSVKRAKTPDVQISAGALR